MQFTVRSLGGKLIIVATLTLLLCILLFVLFAWSTLRSYSIYQAQRDAHTHLSQVQRAYQGHTLQMIQDIDGITHTKSILSTVSQPASQANNDDAREVLTSLSITDHLTNASIFSTAHKVLTTADRLTVSSTDTLQLVNQALQGKPVSQVQLVTQSTGQQQWALSIAVPIVNSRGATAGVLLISQSLDSDFAQTLAQQQSGIEADVLLCTTGHFLGSSVPAMSRLVATHTLTERSLCAAGQSMIISKPQYDLMVSEATSLQQQKAGSPTLVIAIVEPLYNISAHRSSLLLMLAGICVFVFAVGIILYTVVTNALLIRPLQQLQSQAKLLVVNDTGIQVSQKQDNELMLLANLFNALAEALYSEGEALTGQMSNLLIMSDALMSTLNLEHLLGEFVARMGHIMKVKHVALLLYGREALSPWAVAHWSQPAEQTITAPGAEAPGEVTVHIDPDNDVTLAVTSKMAAIPSARPHGTQTKRTRPRASKLTQIQKTATTSSELTRPRIPRIALRDLDKILAQMAIQRKKVVYGEDMLAIYQERKEPWAHLALESGYRSTISIPLLLQDQAIGAFTLYTEEPHAISSRDTFFLTTAALQTSTAIENALLFAEVKEKNVALERANQLKSQFLANVTHELRTPLHSIISYGALILEGFVDGELTTEQEQHIQFMVRRAEDLSHLVDDMLDLSKIEADRIEVKLEVVDLEPCLQEVVNQLKPLAQNKDLYLKLEIADAVPLALADSHRIRQVAINLVSNALKFTEKGGITIRCRHLHSRDMLHISVRDTGIGISPGALGYIFEAFRQADGSTTRRFGGTGLGLTIAKKLIELQGGEIAVESVPGEGSTFSFTLPVIAA